GIRVIGLPGTIDNDLGYTDFTIGFDTAVNTVIDAIGKIRDTSESHGRHTVIEVMGRKCGDIALYAGIASGAEYILLPDAEVDAAAMSRQLLEAKARGKHHSLIVRAEGAPLSTEEITKIIEERTGEECKAVVLGYIQRGGSPTADDRILASRTGYHAVELLKQEGGSRAVGISGNRIIDMDLEEALAIKRKSSPELIAMAEVLSK
ncbi:MAG: ATP-dependent 6-phosphofructokinase, partial [Clostridiales bacterium]|nr:ATP-dependent 6-phosphofructokinase [Clostridiales bacterium]